jgi:hypothetical protein
MYDLTNGVLPGKYFSGKGPRDQQSPSVLSGTFQTAGQQFEIQQPTYGCIGCQHAGFDTFITCGKEPEIQPLNIERAPGFDLRVHLL